MAVAFITERLGDGSSFTLANNLAALPPAPFAGLRLGDRAIALDTRVRYILVPVAAVTTVALVKTTGSIRATNWEWIAD